MRLMVAIFTLCCSFFATANDTTWHWRDLLPESATTYVDPFARFSAMQKFDLFNIMNYIENPEDGSLVEDYETGINRFKDMNIDILTLIESRVENARKRAQAANEINPVVVGVEGRIPGYIVPLEMEGELVTQFLLVPTAGACVHTPPPPANQIVLVTPEEPIELISLYTPVWVEGKMSANQNSSDVQLSDGIAEVFTSYAMSATNVTIYQ